MGKEFFAVYHGVKVPPSPLIGPYLRRTLKEGWYEAREVTAALRLVRPGDRVLELGAGIGVTGAITALNRFPQKVLCYEPNPNLIEPIRALHVLNGLSDMIEVENAVVLAGDAPPPTAKFNVRPNYIGSRLADEAKRGTVIDVPVHPFDAVKARFCPDVLLIDIEGAELDFLEKADLTGIRALVIEFHPKIYGMPGMRHCKSLLRAQGLDRGPGSTQSVWAAVRVARAGRAEGVSLDA